MSYRRSDKPGPFGSRWRLANRSLLVACGVPAEVADSDRRWTYCLLHGDDYPGTGWDVAWVSPQQATTLLAVLERDLRGRVRSRAVFATESSCRRDPTRRT